MSTLVLAAALAAALASDPGSAARPWPPGLIEVPVAGGWTQPVGLTFDAGGRMFVWERAGKVWIVENDVKLAEPLIDLSEEVGNWRDFGLLGFALDPEFLTNGYVYLLYVVDYHHLKYFETPQYDPLANEYFHDTIGRLVRYRAKASDGFRTVEPSSRTVLIGATPQSGFPILHQSHGIGSLVFGEDGTLLVSCGDGASYSTVDAGGPIGGSSNTGLADGIISPQEDVGAFRAQLLQSLSGKVLRIDPASGEGLPSNPWFDAAAPASTPSRVWALGLRNPFRMTLLPESGSHDPADGSPGTLYIGDVGWSSWEELNVCDAPGLNFGWPLFEGLEANPPYQNASPENLHAPNPLFGSAGCTQAWFSFRDLLVQDTLGVPSWPNPCDASQQVPPAIPHFEHRRPLIDWSHSGAGLSRTGTYAGNDAATIPLDDPASPLPGPNFGGSCAVACTYISGSRYGDAYRDVLVFGDHIRKFLYALRLDDAGVPESVETFSSMGETNLVVAAAMDPSTDLLHFIEYLGSGAGVRRLVDVSDQPPIVQAAASPGFGPAPLAVTFSSAGTYDPEGMRLSYLWDFGDGSGSTSPSPDHVFAHVEDVTALGTIVAKVLTLSPPIPLGSGNLDPEVIRDGDFPPAGTQDPLRQYDTTHNGDQGADDWIGYDLGTTRELRSLVFQEGLEFADGGWFGGGLGVQTFDGLAWSDVSGLEVAPLYGGSDGQGLDTWLIRFDPVPARGVRLFGAPGGTGGYISVAELRVFASALTAPAPARRDVVLRVTDLAGQTVEETLVVSLDNTPPSVQILSPVDGALYDMLQDTLVPMDALVTDLEHGPGELTCSWQVSLLHDEHEHPEPPDPSCASAAVVSPVGCDGPSYSYRFTLTVSDAAGLSTAASAYLYPDCCGAQDPLSQTVCAGDPVVFTTSTTATPPVTFQWRKDGLVIPGAVDATYTIPAAAVADAGLYTVVVSGTCGATESKPAELTVLAAVGASAPVSKVACLGGPVEFATTPTGEGPFTFQWRKDGQDIPGATGASLALTSVSETDAGAFSVVVAGACGTLETPPASLTVGGATSSYCTAKTNSAGCTPAIGFTGKPSASGASPFVVRVERVLPAVSGVFFYSVEGAASIPFQGGWLCVAGNTFRSPGLQSTGSAPCSASLQYDLGLEILLGSDLHPLQAGTRFWGQFWSRDPASASGTSLSNALTSVVCP